MEQTYIYTLSDPRSCSVRYVGKSDNPPQRLEFHLKKTSNPNTAVSKWVHGLLALSVSPCLEILDTVPKADWQFWEQHWIQVMRGWGFDLLNRDNGGLDRFRLPDSIKKKISTTLKGRPNRALFKPVNQHAMDGRFIRTFPSFQDAAKAVDSWHANICRAIKYNRSCAGFKWKHAPNIEVRNAD